MKAQAGPEAPAHYALHYNNLDKLVRGYPSKRKSRRWPYSVVFTLIDVAVVASHKLMVTQCASQDDHYKFKKGLAYEMCNNLLIKRQRQPRLRQTVRQALQLVGFDMVCESPHVATGALKADKPLRCDFCPRGKDKKTRVPCSVCSKLRCLEHQFIKCKDCFQSFVHQLDYI